MWPILKPMAPVLGPVVVPPYVGNRKKKKKTQQKIK